MVIHQALQVSAVVLPICSVVDMYKFFFLVLSAQRFYRLMLILIIIVLKIIEKRVTRRVNRFVRCRETNDSKDPCDIVVPMKSTDGRAYMQKMK